MCLIHAQGSVSRNTVPRPGQYFPIQSLGIIRSLQIMSFNIFPVTKEYQEFSFHTLFKVLDACVLSLYLLFPTSTSSTSWKRKDRSQRTIKRSENGRKVKLQSTKKYSLPRNSFFPSNSANHKSIRKGVTVTTQTTVSADCLPLKCRPSVSRGRHQGTDRLYLPGLRRDSRRSCYYLLAQWSQLRLSQIPSTRKEKKIPSHRHSDKL